MVENSEEKSVIDTLLKLSELDSSLARVLAEKSRQLNDIEVAKQKLDDLTLRFETVKGEFDTVRNSYNSEEKWIKEEKEKLKDRRKALSTFSNYKIQQNAQQEIQRAERLISAREDSALLLVEKQEKLEILLNQSQLEVESAQSVLDDANNSIQETVRAFDEQYSEKKKVRDSVAATLAPDAKTIYEQVKSRYDVDPVVRVKGTNCGSCFMNVAPQQMVLLLQCKQIIRCRGCKRILASGEEAQS